MKKYLKLFAIAFLIISMSISPVFAGDFGVKEITDSILELKLKEGNFASYQELVNSFALSPGTGEDWYVLTLRNTREDVNYQDYRNALLDYLKTKDFTNAVEKQRTALVYLSVNGDRENISEIADETIGKLGIMSYVFGLHLLNNGAISEKYTKEGIIKEILSLQTENGGWAVMNSGNPEIDTTAMTIQALSVALNQYALTSYYDENTDGIYTETLDAINKAITILSDKMQDNGCYVTFGNENPECSAQVIFALKCMGIDALSDERFIKNGTTLLDGLLLYRLPDGSFSHTSNGSFNKTSTNQALYCLTGYQMLNENKGNFYLFDKVNEPEYTAPQTDKKDDADGLSTKTIIYISIAVLAAVWMIVLALKHKKSYKSYLSVLIVAAVAFAGAYFIDIEKPEDYYQDEEYKEGEYITTTLSIKCETIAGKESYIPENGIIVDFASIKIPTDGTVYDQLIAACKQYKIHLESDPGYIKGINNIYEFTFGDLSGWMYRVNGEYYGISSADFKLNENDYVEWIYTLELGKDIGNDYN